MPFDSAVAKANRFHQLICFFPATIFFSDVYSQIYRVLKPGQIFACYEWCLTPKYNKDDAQHRLYKKKIEEGTSLYLFYTLHDAVLFSIRCYMVF